VTEPAEPRRAPELESVLRAFGVPDDAIARTLARGDPLGAIADAIPARGAARRTVSPAEIESAFGMPIERITELMRAFGLAIQDPQQRAFTPEEAEGLRHLWQLRNIWPFEFSVQLGRVYGRLLARIAHASVQLWVSGVEPRLRAADVDDRRRALAAAETFDGLLPVADVLLTGVHRRWIEHEAAQLATRGAESDAGETGLLGAVEVSLLFCDLKDFTAFADRQGDGAAVRIIDQFADVVTREHGPDARLAKLLGDGFMLAYPQPGLAVSAAIRIIDRMRGPDNPGVHASVHHGRAIPHEGDYFGSAVNLAARLLGAAGRDELVATRAVVVRCPDVGWEPAGKHRVRGVSEPVEVFRLRAS
jgi:class 3 adenylate cyclase